MTKPTPTEELARAMDERAWCSVRHEFVAARLRELSAENQRLRESRRGLAERVYKIACRTCAEHMARSIYDILAEEPSDGG